MKQLRVLMASAEELAEPIFREGIEEGSHELTILNPYEKKGKFLAEENIVRSAAISSTLSSRKKGTVERKRKCWKNPRSQNNSIATVSRSTRTLTGYNYRANLGVLLCHCTFPPPIMLTSGMKSTDFGPTEQFKCPK